jgi:DNA repair exonuclease SbcCD ATPase subunit
VTLSSEHKETTDLSASAYRISERHRWSTLIAERNQLLDQVPQGFHPGTAQSQLHSIEQQLNQLLKAQSIIHDAERDLKRAQGALGDPPSSTVQTLMLKDRDQAMPEVDWVDLVQHRKVAELFSILARELTNLKVVKRDPTQEVWTVSHDNELSMLQTHLGHERTREKIEGWRVQLGAHKNELEVNTARLYAAHELERLSREAELQTLEQHLVSLNAVLQQLLDQVMFQDGNEMQCGFSALNTGKPEVSMTLYQRGQPCDERSLSGGEYDRLALAVSLALYRLFSIKLGLLCLDESLSSLDAEVANSILMRLHDDRALVGGPVGLIIMVDHHGGTGMFDHTLSLVAAAES